MYLTRILATLLAASAVDFKYAVKALYVALIVLLSVCILITAIVYVDTLNS